MDIRVASWSELQERLYEESWKPQLGRFRSDLAFRGMPSARFDLQTSLMRLGGHFPEFEGHLLRNFRKYAYSDADTVNDSDWNWLAIGQHHGLPTRMLDWTYSPLVALHFATFDLTAMTDDAMIWCVDYVKSNRLLPEPLAAALREEGSNIFTVEMLQRTVPTLEEFDRLGEREFVIFLEPPSIDQRIVNQYALFSAMSSATSRLDRFLESHPELSRRIVIPAELKWEVRDKLDQANVNERVLFPGLDGLSAWLKRHYLPRETLRPVPRDPQSRPE